MASSRGACAAIAPLLVIALAVGCSSYSSRSPLIREALVRADYEAALEEVEKIGRSDSELLYCYERGLILHESGDYAGSNQAFERAEQLLDELYTRSISREIASVTINETIVKYRGDAFEAVFVNYYKILNYLYLGEIEGALVECRRLNARLQLIHDAGETYFVDNAFLRYLTALVYELGGEWESAEVSYRAAAQRYAADSTGTGAPRWLYCDAAANAALMGDDAQVLDYRARAECDSLPAETGRVALLVECGSVARKVEASFTVPIFESDRWDDEDEFSRELASRRGTTYAHPPEVKYWLSVALPALQVDPRHYSRVVVRATLEGGRRRGEEGEEVEVQAACVEDLDVQAARAFAEKEGDVVLRAVARALAKYLATSVAEEQDETLGALVNLLGVVTETADTRSWTALPASIHLARLDLEPGRYRIETEVFNADGLSFRIETLSGVEVRRGGLTVRSLRMR